MRMGGPLTFSFFPSFLFIAALDFFLFLHSLCFHRVRVLEDLKSLQKSWSRDSLRCPVETSERSGLATGEGPNKGNTLGICLLC